MRQIIKYKNRKYYDKTTKGYINLSSLQNLVEEGELLEVTEKTTNKDITYATLVSVLSNKLSKENANNESIINLINNK